MSATPNNNSILNLTENSNVIHRPLQSLRPRWSYSKEACKKRMEFKYFCSRYGMSSSLPPPSEYLPAKAKVDQIIAAANISSKSFATSPVSRSNGQVLNSLLLKIPQG